jgi:hypothetical protein
LQRITGGRVAKSRKRSGSSGVPKPPEPPVFFIDRCLGKQAFPRPLIEAGLEVELHDDHFAIDCPDELWLAEAGRRDWIVVTRDLRIRYREVERDAAFSNQVRIISLTARRLSADDLGRAFATHAVALRRFLVRMRGPFIATMSARGDIKIVSDRRLVGHANRRRGGRDHQGRIP